MTLLTITQVAERLQCSRAHVHNLIKARWCADTMPDSHIPPRLKPLTDLKFSRPRYLGASTRMPRIDERDLTNWLKRQEQ